MSVTQNSLQERMIYKSIIHTPALRVMVIIVSIGLISACGNSETSESNESSEMEVTPQAQQQDRNTRESDAAVNEEQTFEATLSGANQVPEAVDTDASGNVTITLRGDSIQVQGKFSNLSSEYMASHIHIATEDENGDPIQPLNPELGDDETSGTWNSSYQLDEELISALQSDSLYVNVHSSKFTGGEIRGQLTAAAKRNM